MPKFACHSVDYKPPVALRNRHLQSVIASVPPRRSLVRQAAAGFLSDSRQVVIDCGEGVRMLGYHTEALGPKSKGLVVMLHGWEGSADSTYILSVAPKLVAAGYSVFRLNFRDHGGSQHLNRELFHSCRLQEVVDAIAWIQRNYRAEELFLTGFSLGGNFSLRVAAEAHNANINIARVIAVCPVLDPAQTMIALDAGWSGYQSYFIRKWSRSLKLKQRAFPQLYQFNRLRDFKTLSAMTEHFVLSYTEYPDLHTYLRGYAITGDRLIDLRVPAVMLLAEDDPVIPFYGLQDMRPSDFLQVYRSEKGGHCGFISDMQLNSWVDGFILRQLDAAE
jgi:predicted alpha/beta-fold hydrolase